MNIDKLVCNFSSKLEGLDGFDTYELGLYGVEKIQEHRAAGEGDRWYYDIHYEDGTKIREFYPRTVHYKQD